MAFWDIGATNIAGAALGGFGASSANKAASKAQKREQAFIREQMNNRHQWEVDDLKAAGLNPMLSAGAAPSMGGSPTRQIFDEGAAAGAGAVSATSSRRNSKESDLLEAQEKVAVNTAMREAAQAELATAQAANQRKETQFNFGDDTVTIDGFTPYGFRNLQMDNLYSDMTLTKSQNRYVNELRTKVMPEIEKLISERKLDEARTAFTRASEEAERLGLPKLRNEAAAQSTPWKKEVSPYLDDVGKITNSAGDLTRIRRNRFEFNPSRRK